MDAAERQRSERAARTEPRPTPEEVAVDGGCVLRSGPDAAARGVGAGLSQRRCAPGVSASSQELPGEELLYGIFDVVGETLPAMALAPAGGPRRQGLDPGAVQAARTRPPLRVRQVQPFARVIIDEHHAAGRKVVWRRRPRTTSCAARRRLGLDDVVATRYGERGRRLRRHHRRPLRVGAGKLGRPGVGGEHGVDLRESWAYCDSVYDAPLLTAVDHPFAVNPDPRLLVCRAEALAGAAPRRARRASPSSPVVGSSRSRCSSCSARPGVPVRALRHRRRREHPEDGPVILVANHRSYFDGPRWP